MPDTDPLASLISSNSQGLPQNPASFTAAPPAPQAASTSAAPAGLPDTSAITGAVDKVKADKYKEAETLDAQAREAIKAISGQGTQIDEMMTRVRAAQDKADEAQTAATKALAAPPKQPELDALKKLNGLGTVVGILGGLFTRRPMIGSLNAAADAMEAYNKGDAENYKVAYGNWKTQTDMLFKIADMQASRVKDIMSNESMGLNERKAMLDVTLRAAGLSQLADAARTAGDSVVVDWLEKQQTAAQQYQTHLDTIENTQAYRMALLENKGWQILEDPATLNDKGKPTLYRLNANTGQSETLDGKPYTPEGAAKIGSAGAGGDTPLTDADAKYWGQVLKSGGALPSGLARTAAGSNFVQKTMHYAGTDAGDPGDFIANHATVKADSNSLNNMTKMADAATSFEKTASLNFDKAMQLAPNAVPTQLGPFFNRWISDGETMAGDPTVPPYVMAMLTGANEYAKIMTGSTGAQGSTVDSRREAAELFSPYLSLPQIKQVIAVAKYDMDNRKQSLYGQVDDIKSRLKNAGSSDPTASQMDKGGAGVKPLPVPAGHAKDPDGTPYNGSDGHVYIKRGDQMVPQ